MERVDNSGGSSGAFSEEAPGASKVAALIGAVTGSRRDPGQLESELAREIEDLNRRLGSSLAADLVVLPGNEIQGTFHRPDGVVDVVVGLEDRLFPTHLNYGLGYGDLAPARRLEPTQLDGSCFHHARKALEVARKKSTWLRARGFGAVADEVVSALFQLMWAIRRRWTRRQAEFANATRGTLQRRVAETAGVSPSVVSESLKAASFASLQEGESAVKRYLAELAVGHGLGRARKG